MQPTAPLLRAVRGNTLPIKHGVDYTGKLIGSWTVLGPIRCDKATGKSTYKTCWLCQCSCGSDTQWVHKEGLFRGATKGCFHCTGSRNSRENNPNWRGHGEISGEAFNKVRSGARQRNITLEVDSADLHALWIAQDRKCALTGLALVMGDTASLDRIDSQKAYVIDNIQWVHKVVNIMKNDFTEDVFIAMCSKVAAYKAAKNTAIEHLIQV